jgi:hypothetical protein
MTVKVDKKKAESLIRRAVRDRGPDTVGTVDGKPHSNCTYRKAGKPVCLVGQVFSYVTDKPLGRVFTKDVNLEGIDLIWSTVEKRAGVEFTDGAKSLLEKVQDRQDAGNTWGEVVKVVLPKR